MTKRVAVAVCFLLALACGSAVAAETPSPYITDAEYAALLKLLDDSQDRLMSRLTGMTDEQWNFRENADRWSVAECVEHITRGEAAMLERIEKLAQTPPDPDWYQKTQGKVAILEQYIPNPMPQGQGGVRAPEELEPTEKWDRARGIRQFYETHGKVRAFVETMDRNVKDRTMESTVPLFGWMNTYDWLHSLAFHIARHTKQIEKVQADPKYPAKAAGPTVTEQDPRLSDEEIVQLIKELDEAQDFLMGRISGMTDEQWAFKQNPSRWSVAECVEHISRGETVILGGIAYAFSQPPNPDWYEQTKGKAEWVRANTPNRTPGGVGSPFRAPYEVAPSQNWARGQAIREFYKSHGEVRAMVETMPREAKNRTFLNPFPQIGMMNVYDWLVLQAMHAVRHTKQIIEVQEDPGYPAKAAPVTGGR